MKRLVVAASLAAATFGPLASPVLAQSYHEAVVAPGQELDGQLEQLEARLQRGVARGAIDRGEASRALNEIGSIRREADDLRARHGGRLGDDDRLRLQGRLDHLSQSLRWMNEESARGTPPGGGRGAGPIGPGGGLPGGAWNGERFWSGAPAGPYERIDWLRERIRHGVDDGSLDRIQAQRAFGDLRSIEVMARRLTARDGGRLNGPDAAYLQSRLDRLSRGLRWAEHHGY